MTEEALTDLGVKVVEGYEKDKKSRKEWEDIAEELLSLASQDKPVQPKTTPWTNSSNVNIPLLTIAALQWNARMYPAAIKGDEALLCKVVGQDNGVPEGTGRASDGDAQRAAGSGDGRVRQPTAASGWQLMGPHASTDRLR
jgi:chaperonin GroES